jgi:mannosyltransferase OCH1-like enzyme
MPITFEAMSDVIRSLPTAVNPGTGEITIPRRIMQFWDATTPPPEVSGLMETWGPMHPGFEVMRFDASAAAEWLGDHYPPRYVDAFFACQHPAMQSDYFRLAYLHVLGGIYIDADERCVQSLAPLTNLGVELVLNRRVAPNGLHYFNNAPLLCRPELPILRECLDWATTMISAAHGQPLKIWVTTGPGNLSRIFARRILEDPASLPRTFILDDWAAYSEIRFCAYKYGSRYWLTHDRFLEGRANGLRHLLRLWRPRFERAASRLPGAAEVWRMVKALRAWR